MRSRILFVLFLSLLILCLACSDNECPEIDDRSPDSVTDLTVSEVGPTYVELKWTATGDDDTSCPATKYDIRYASAVSHKVVAFLPLM
jgi:hypothetical protein